MNSLSGLLAALLKVATIILLVTCLFRVRCSVSRRWFSVHCRCKTPQVLVGSGFLLRLPRPSNLFATPVKAWHGQEQAQFPDCRALLNTWISRVAMRVMYGAPVKYCGCFDVQMMDTFLQRVLRKV